MDLIDSLIGRLRKASSYAQIALAAECADRVYPIYEEYQVGTYSKSVRRSIEIGWSYACRATVDEAEIQSCLAEVQDIVEFYREEGIDVLGDTVTVVLRVLQALTPDEEKSSLAVARALVSARDAAQSAEAMANLEKPKASRTEVAAEEESAWQERALSVIDGRKGVAIGNMFESLDDKPPRWFQDWKQHSRG